MKKTVEDVYLNVYQKNHETIIRVDKAQIIKMNPGLKLNLDSYQESAGLCKNFCQAPKCPFF